MEPAVNRQLLQLFYSCVALTGKWRFLRSWWRLHICFIASTAVAPMTIPETKFSFSIKNIFNPVSQITFPIRTNCAALRQVPLACATLYKNRASPRLSSVVHTVLINAAKLLDGVERYFVRQFHLVEFIFAFPTPQKRIAIVLIQGSATPCYIWIYVSD